MESAVTDVTTSLWIVAPFPLWARCGLRLALKVIGLQLKEIAFLMNSVAALICFGRLQRHRTVANGTSRNNGDRDSLVHGAPVAKAYLCLTL